MNHTGPHNKGFTVLLVGTTFMLFIMSVTYCFGENSSNGPVYVGSLACKSCHEKEYISFTTYAKKSKSYKSIEMMKKGLTEDDMKKCYSCHTTGYGKPGGFVSVEKTPHLKNAGCEVCHGPGSLHIQSEDFNFIEKQPTLKVCNTCHTSERITDFRYTPLIHGGGH